MGKDSVVECVKESGAVKAYTSMTVVGSGKFDSPRTGIVRKNCDFFSGKYLRFLYYSLKTR